MRPYVVVVHTEDGLRSEVLDAVRDQGFSAVTVLTPEADRFAYATALRKLWRVDYDYILLEQDVVMPPGTLAALAACQEPWCSHPHWMGDHYGTTTTGVVRWAPWLRRQLPSLMEQVCAPPDPRYWVRRGWTKIAHDCHPNVLNGPGRRACLVPGAPAEATSTQWGVRPTTHDWHGIDSDLALKLAAQGVNVHVHPVETIHLHDYDQVPVHTYQPWYELPYDPQGWPPVWRPPATAAAEGAAS